MSAESLPCRLLGDKNYLKSLNSMIYKIPKLSLRLMQVPKGITYSKSSLPLGLLIPYMLYHIDPI